MTAVDAWLLIGAGAAFATIVSHLAHACADCWDGWHAARERRDIITANEQAATETWCEWLPTAAGMAVREAELAAGAYRVRSWPVGVSKPRLAAVVERRAA